MQIYIIYYNITILQYCPTVTVSVAGEKLTHSPGCSRVLINLSLITQISLLTKTSVNNAKKQGRVLLLTISLSGLDYMPTVRDSLHEKRWKNHIDNITPSSEAVSVIEPPSQKKIIFWL